MSMISVFYHPQTEDVAISTYSFDFVHRASGPLIRMSAKTFAETGTQLINEELSSGFYNREPSTPSELYQLMPRAESGSFQREHRRIDMRVGKGTNIAKLHQVRANREIVRFPEMSFPLDPATFPDKLLQLFLQCEGHGPVH